MGWLGLWLTDSYQLNHGNECSIIIPSCYFICQKAFSGLVIISDYCFVGSSNAGPILSNQSSQQITLYFHPLLQQHQILSIDHFIPFHLKYCINTVKKRFEHQHEQYIWVIHENRLAYVCPWITTATINHCHSLNNNMYVSFVIILKYAWLIDILCTSSQKYISCTCHKNMHAEETRTKD